MPPVTIFFLKTSAAYGYFSNFSKHGIELDDAFWPTTEHYYQGMKTLNVEEREAIRSAATPREAKNLGMACTLRDDWELSVGDEKMHALFSDDRGVVVEFAKDHYMFSALTAKFVQHEDLRARLLETGDAILVEDFHKDSYWANGADRNGLNKLGRMLMFLRRRIREGALDAG